VENGESIEDRFLAGPTDKRSTEEKSAPTTGNSRRRFLTSAFGTAAGIVGGMAAAGAVRGIDVRGNPVIPIRPPGSVPEGEFLALCVRCGECFRACPNDVIQPMGFSQGLDGLWTPHVLADWSGCEPSCNNCGQVCPTGAIRAIPLEEKRAARMALAVIDRETCLPYVATERGLGVEGNCRLCVDECAAAGYDAIEFVRVGTQADASGKPIEESGYLAPVVLPERCVGCGICQTRCRVVHVVQHGRLTQAAIRIEAGAGNEDRLLSGSYLELRRDEQARRQRLSEPVHGDGYLPEFLE
jgi:NAD-dependent dihydropyrimidine dehydrogenase PreA subunit